MVDVKKLALLARIKISEKEEESLKKEFEKILNYVSKLERADISSLGDVDINQTTGLTNQTREDVGGYAAGEFAEDLLKGAPAVENNYVKVKRILE